MTFLRTRSGQSNRFLFHRTIYVMYVEGGNYSYTVNAALDGQYNTAAYDIKFWKHITDRIALPGSIAIHAVGSKAALSEIADRITADEISRSLVAMDRDYDDFIDEVNPHPYVMRTYGYGWENDVWHPYSVVLLLDSLTLLQLDTKALAEEIAVMAEEFSVIIAPCVNLDVKLVKASRKTIIPRKSSSRCFSGPVGTKPTLKCKRKEEVRAQCRESVDVTGLPNEQVQLEIRYCPAHFYADFYYRVVSYYMRRFGEKELLSRRRFAQLGLAAFGQILNTRDDPKLCDYYHEMIRRCIEALDE